tara:strand:- start:705 stop:1217 length:513 start_codon:yes stop_codon:yes gene_type:complete
MKNMNIFVKKYLTEHKNKKLRILDIGSQQIGAHQTYKTFFNNSNWEYVGVDIVAGNNVNIVLSDIYSWKEVEDNFADVIISGQAFEHIEYIWLTMKEVERVVKPGGLICLIAPSAGVEHRYPVDCWRIYPDGFRALAKYVGLETISAYADQNEPPWKDCVLIARKPDNQK